MITMVMPAESLENPDGNLVRDKDRPLRDDIRLLGRILGETVRDQDGQAVYDVVERIRRVCIRFRRDADEGARRELAGIFEQLSGADTARVIRAFTYFSHLANIAEDQHHIRRTRAHAIAGSPPREGTMAHALAAVRAAGVSTAQLGGFFAAAQVVPVLTAHPTEVRRRSTLDCEREIATLLAERDDRQLTPEEAAAVDGALRRAVLALWHTAISRSTRLAVADEIANGIAYYDYTFFREIPRLYASLEDELDAAGTIPLPSFLRMGSWIGGDRDGNPFVTAEVLRRALSMQSEHALGFYLDELHTLGAELSLHERPEMMTADLARLIERSPDRSPHRAHEPFRRAISGLYARLAATARALNGTDVLRAAVGEAAPYDVSAALCCRTTILQWRSRRSGNCIRC